MDHRTENSAVPRGLVIEVVGPLLDDGGLFSRTIGDLLVGEQVVLRPGAVEQVAGAAVEWALATLAEGHGRFELLDRLPEFTNRLNREWARLAPSGLIGAAAGARVGWRAAQANSVPILLLFGGPPAVAVELLTGLDMESSERVEVAGAGAAGLPRADTITDWLTRHRLDPAMVRAAVSSQAAALAAAGARIGEVVLIGDAGKRGVGLPVDRTVMDLAALSEAT